MKLNHILGLYIFLLLHALESCFQEITTVNSVFSILLSLCSLHLSILLGFPSSSDGKTSACNAGDPGSIPGLGRSPGEGNGNPLQHSCLENSMDRGAWWPMVYGVTKSQTRLSN